MNRFFRMLPLQAKLMLIGMIPFCFLLYLTTQVYKEKTEKLAIFNNYKTYIEESENISSLIRALQEERKFSFDYLLTKNMQQELVLQRPKTDALLNILKKSNDPALTGFIQYTKLKELESIRNRVDSSKVDANGVMHFYSNTIFRLNTLNTIPPANTAYLQPVYKDLMAQKILSEMSTYFGIIRSNIYNVLQTRAYMVETLIGTMGTYDVYKSYEEELLAKAPKDVLEKYKNVKTATAYKPTVAYVDVLFKTFVFGDTYTAAEWWAISDEGSKELEKLQEEIWKGLSKDINTLYHKEETARNETFLFLILALVSVVLIVCYIVYVISRTLRRLRQAAEKISNGETGVNIPIESDDVIGSLARSIRKIDETNQTLTNATIAIGKGKFDIAVEPRSEKDVLGNAIKQMKEELQQYSHKMEDLVTQRTEQLARSNEDLQQFAHVASHDLKEPLRKISTFSNILIEDQKDNLTEKGNLYLQKIESASRRMSLMIEGVLAYSTVSTDEESYEAFSLNALMEEVKGDLELAIIQKDAQINYGKLPKISGMHILLYQLFYNLISNSLKFTKPGIPPVINISAETVTKTINKKTGEFVHIAIRDNGIGFNPDYAEKMFGVFSRLNSKEEFEGTGLGLALCKKIVMRHEGEIYAEGEDGKGATFHVFLPV
jgi:signal transduction histidine kinase